VGDLSQSRNVLAGQSSSISGYVSGGGDPSVPNNYSNKIDKFPFASDGNATNVADLTQAIQGNTGQSSAVSGYSSGGYFPPFLYAIDKFPFASDANATFVGNLTVARQLPAGQSSTEYGYNSGGMGGGPTSAQAPYRIDKFPFASDSNATNVGDLTIEQVYGGAGQSSTASGYTSGGATPPSSNVIQKFPFATDSNSSDVGDLTVAAQVSAGQQY
jgi:hypothetical protein